MCNKDTINWAVCKSHKFVVSATAKTHVNAVQPVVEFDEYAASWYQVSRKLSLTILPMEDKPNSLSLVIPIQFSRNVCGCEM